VAAIMITDMILGKKNLWEEVFDPNRVKLNSTYGELTKKNLSVGKHFVKHRVELKKIPLDKLMKGEAALTNIEGKDVAVYRDEAGLLHVVSPKCSHLGCYINWNNAEQHGIAHVMPLDLPMTGK
jgi:Rieske Fe-S protein